MIEIVAAALAKTIGLNFDSLPETDETYGSSGIYGKSHYRCLARAAVEAMRDPGFQVLMDGYHATGQFGRTWGELNDVWNAQINEALK